MLKVIVAVAKDKSGRFVIGQGNDMPWKKIKADLAHFKETTLKHPVAMGRKTWESIPEKYRPLPGRRNLVLTRDKFFEEKGAEVVSPEYVIRLAQAEDVFVVGGGEIYKLFMPYALELFVTFIDLEIDGDTFFPEIKKEDGWCRTKCNKLEAGKQSPYGLIFRKYIRVDADDDCEDFFEGGGEED